VFVSYSRQDAEWLRRVATMLKPLVRGRRCELWFDTLIGTGQQWQPEVDDAIARADIALLLVSPDFLASDFIMGCELPALIKRGVRLAAMLLRDCHHCAVDELCVCNGRKTRRSTDRSRPQLTSTARSCAPLPV
jgi:hypothetical protein